MTTEQLKKALDVCSEYEECVKCPAYSFCGDLAIVTGEALNAIEAQATKTNYLISIRKPFTDFIFRLDELENTKTNEWRKKPLPKGHYFVYESKHKHGCGKVVGEFDIVANHAFPIGSISFEDCQAHDLVRRGMVPYGFLKRYANGREIIYANIIENAKHYDTARELTEFNAPCPHRTITGREGDCPCNEYGWDWDEQAGKAFCTRRITRPPQSYQRVEGDRNDRTKAHGLG